jgi:hypothetical protein
MSDDIIRNPNRRVRQVIPPYEPEYVKRGVEPIKMPSDPEARSINIQTKSEDKQEEAFVVDEYASDEKGHYIDNNDYVFPPENVLATNKQPKTVIINNPQIKQDKSKTNSLAPQIGEYILMYSGKIILSGPESIIENKIKNMIYGDDIDFSEETVLAENIVVLKRIDIKIGVFLNE